MFEASGSMISILDTPKDSATPGFYLLGLGDKIEKAADKLTHWASNLLNDVSLASVGEVITK